MTNHYELLYLVAANYTEDELLPIKEKVKKLVEKFEGEITMEDSLGKKKLAYPIKDSNQGYYLLYEINLEGEKLKDLDKELRLTNEVLRHIIVSRKIKSPSLVKKSAERVEAIEAAIEAPKPAEVEVKKADDKRKIKLEDLDERLDEILDGDIL